MDIHILGGAAILLCLTNIIEMRRHRQAREAHNETRYLLDQARECIEEQQKAIAMQQLQIQHMKDETEPHGFYGRRYKLELHPVALVPPMSSDVH